MIFFRKVSPPINQVSKGQDKFPQKAGSLDRPALPQMRVRKKLMKLKLKTFREGDMIPAHSFFILNKGLNSGRPSLTPNVNCFICSAENENHHNRYYWLSYALWATGKFRQCLMGSVIPFIRIDDTVQLLDIADCAAQNQGQQFIQGVEILYELQDISKKAVLWVRDIQVAKMKVLKIFAHL